MKENQRVTITKRMLQEGLLRLLKDKKLDKIRVSELCEEAGINRATFYRHYETPHDVLVELERDFLRQAIPNKPPKNINEAHKMLENTCTYVYEHADIAKLLFLCNTEEDMMRIVEEFYQHFIELHRAEENFPDIDEASIRIITAYMGGGGYNLLRKWIVEDIPKTPKEITELLHCMLCWVSDFS